ncbi:MAG: hypothetical protein J6X94_06520 [Lachnospiraceae bacterium]|nr:hypothetical protein [Lachnospiraceae bacterium]
MFVFTLGVCLKRIFADFDYDSGYAAAIGYRILKGDRMFAEMWEPHQISAFLCAFLELIYIKIAGTTTGIILYLHVMGAVIKTAVAMVFYKALGKVFARDNAFVTSCIFMILSPKLLIIPEYSNMQVYSSVLLFSFLIFFITDKKPVYLALSSVSLFLAVLAYPSCVIMWIAALIILFRYTDKGLKNLCFLTLICLFLGILYMGGFALSLGIHDFLNGIAHIATSDPSHSAGVLSKLTGYGKDLLSILASYIIIAGISVLAVRIKNCVKKDSGETNRKNFVIIFLILCGIWQISDALMMNTDYCFLEFQTGLLIAGLVMSLGKKNLQKDVLSIALIISVFQMLSTAILSNLSLNSSLGYMILGVCISFSYLYEYETGKDAPERLGFIRIFPVIPIVFINLFIVRSMSFCYINLTDIAGVSKKGPMIGIFSEYMAPYILDRTYEEWQDIIPDGSTVLISGNCGMMDGASSLEYLFKDVEIAVKDTQTSCVIDESQGQYFIEHPEKKPDVVEIVCWYGESKEPDDSWLMNMLRDNYGDEYISQNYYDGSYRRYYFLNK